MRLPLRRRSASVPTRPSMAAGIVALARLGFAPETIVDVGASDGRWSELAMASFPAARYVLFEPQPVHAEALRRFEAAHRDRTTIVRSAVGGKSGTTFFDASDPSGGVVQEERQSSSIQVPVTTLDAALETASARPPFLVKLDTHGHESSIVAGAATTLGDSVAWIVEAYNYRLTPDCLLFWELCARMQEYGFRPIDAVDILHREHDGTFWQMDLFFVHRDWPGFAHTEYV